MRHRETKNNLGTDSRCYLLGEDGVLKRERVRL